MACCCFLHNYYNLKVTYEWQRILSAGNTPPNIWRPQFLQPIFLIILPELKTCRANMRFSDSGISYTGKYESYIGFFPPETLVSTAVHSEKWKDFNKEHTNLFFQLCGVFEELLNELVQLLLLCCLYFLSEIYILFRRTRVYVFFLCVFWKPLNLFFCF